MRIFGMLWRCFKGGDRGPVTINISRAWLGKQFNCTPDFITTTCKGKCCQGAKEIMVTVAPDERKFHKRGIIAGNMLIPDGRNLCPYKNDSGLCDVHDTPQKPFGCIVSPFTINKNGTLIVRHRYIHMPCYGQGAPAYIAFRASLVLMFGEVGADDITRQMEGGSGDIRILIDREVYDKVLYLDGIKRKRHA